MRKAKEAKPKQVNTTLLIQSKYALSEIIDPACYIKVARNICVRKSCAHVTNGRALVTVPCEGSGTTDILIPPALFVQARRNAVAQRNDTAIMCKGGMMTAATKDGTVTVDEPTANEPFPDTTQVMRAPTDDEVHVGLDAALLEKLQRALGACTSVELHFRIDAKRTALPEAIRVTVPGDAGVVGAIMPCVDVR